MKKRLMLIAVVLCAFTMTACQHVSPTKSDATKQRISIMTFNVENLFDTQHDDLKDDYTYLPFAHKQSQVHKARCQKISVEKWREQCLYWDWSKSVVDYKLSHIAQVIKQYDNGNGPDIIVFQEVENSRILRRLKNEYLIGKGYREPVLVEGKDLRGIDVAFMSRFLTVGLPKLHDIDFAQIDEKRKADTRGILQADFKLPNGDILTGFAVHFPAPFHPFALRIDSYKSLNKLVKELPADRVAFAAGDFNTPSTEDNEQNMLATHVKATWLITHEISCDACAGTYYYAPKKEWSFLDMILVRRSADVVGNWQLDPNGTQLINKHHQQQDTRGYPKGFEIDGPSGISDHWPLLIELSR